MRLFGPVISRTKHPKQCISKPHDSDTDNESNSANKPLIQYAPQAKQTPVQTPVTPEQKKQVKELIQQQAHPYNLRSRKT